MICSSQVVEMHSCLPGAEELLWTDPWFKHCAYDFICCAVPQNVIFSVIIVLLVKHSSMLCVNCKPKLRNDAKHVKH
jgi:hypothetical protein